MHAGESEDVSPRDCAVRSHSKQSARTGFLGAGTSMVTQLGDHLSGLWRQPEEAYRKPAKAQPAPLPTLLTSFASAAAAPATCCSKAGVTATASAVTVPGEAALSAVFDEDAQDPQKVGEYAPDIFATLLDKETLCLPRPDYMDSQADINGKMRAILIDWLVEVHLKHHSRPETLFLTVNIIDRYLSIKPVARKKLQLLGVVALLIAAKFEEIQPPSVHELSRLTDKTCSKKDILDMEVNVLVALGFQIAAPTPAHFLDRLQRANGCQGMHSALAQYALELSLLDTHSLRYPPSVLVGASLLLSNAILGRKPVWPVAMAHCTRQTEVSLWECAEELRRLMQTAPTATLQAVRRKYQVERWFAVSRLSVPGPDIFGQPRKTCGYA